ncbi:MAG: DUF3501 family protein [Ilumatobacteraceae bacterium]|jgi:hypothetical protein|nr:DUF3501 family protein [Acidimicrobiaceae bacterium]MBP6487668.1 DUF3501 family protein [Ilumatobacteraceae bacterium]MBP7890690.1 DUF3501 family protein [Ilumatobacteraceae bacterium]MBP8210897.1 DUF3501 family protein [Ilumatobacteraceae bacterium]HAN35744.1 DUF3501 domain-containing protein [Acidimicrobiaceae bacterium]
MTTELSSRKLTLDDIADARAYERERTELRARVIDLKSRRRVSLGTVVTLMFENRDTMRYQIQEMARVERTFTDQGIQEELDVYNPLIPEPGQLCATLFIELTSDDQMREWLSKLVGIEHSVVFHLPDGDTVRCVVDPQHAAQLTREHVTAAVHYITFQFTPAQVAAFVDGVVLAIDHPEYLESVELLPSTISELRADLT